LGSTVTFGGNFMSAIMVLVSIFTCKNNGLVIEIG
jgi:hypothetical protein